MHDFDKVDKVKRRIIDLYKVDMAKHATGYEGRVRAILGTLPSQLSRHEKKFRITAISESAKTRMYADAFFWLTDAMIINNCYNSSEPNVGLMMNVDSSSVKCYMADTGLLLSIAFSENEIVSRRLYYEILTGDLLFNEGMVMENIVAQMLVSSGHRLFFYSKSSDNKDDRMEIDFLISKSIVDRDHNVSPIEVKSGIRYTLTSLKKYMRKYGRYLDTPYVLHIKDLMIKDGITYLPLYMAYLL